MLYILFLLHGVKIHFQGVSSDFSNFFCKDFVRTPHLIKSVQKILCLQMWMGVFD